MIYQQQHDWRARLARKLRDLRAFMHDASDAGFADVADYYRRKADELRRIAQSIAPNQKIAT